MSPRRLEVLRLGRQRYEPVWRAMQVCTDARGPATPDQLWLVEHEPVFTLGQAGKREHLLAPGEIPVLAVDRGGQVTYHGPGQVVAYPLLDLRRLGLGVRALVDHIEGAVIAALAGWGIAGQRRPGAPGVYVGEAKVMALGLRVRRGCSLHGLALNVAMDLTPYQRINPCGYKGLEVTDLARLGGPRELRVVEDELVRRLSAAFGLSAVEIADARARLAAPAAA